MEIAILFGDKSNRVSEVIRDSMDDKEIRPFTTISSFINYVRQSNSSCNRILVNTNTLKSESDLEALHTFLRQDLPSTSVVFLVSAQDTSNIQQAFSNIYNLSIYTDITTQQESLQFIIECITESITDLRSKYSAMKDVNYNEDLELTESYNESLSESGEVGVGEEVILAFDYLEPILSSEESSPVNPKDKNKLAEIKQTALENQGYSQMLLDHRAKMFSEGYFTSKHYPLNLADVDPTVMLFKQRQQDTSPRVISVFKPSLESIRSTLEPRDILRLSYAEHGVLNYSGFYDVSYTSTPLAKGLNSNIPGNKANKKAKEKKRGFLSKIFGR